MFETSLRAEPAPVDPRCQADADFERQYGAALAQEAQGWRAYSYVWTAHDARHAGGDIHLIVRPDGSGLLGGSEVGGAPIELSSAQVGPFEAEVRAAGAFDGIVGPPPKEELVICVGGGVRLFEASLEGRLQTQFANDCGSLTVEVEGLVDHLERLAGDRLDRSPRWVSYCNDFRTAKPVQVLDSKDVKLRGKK